MSKHTRVNATTKAGVTLGEHVELMLTSLPGNGVCWKNEQPLYKQYSFKGDAKPTITTLFKGILGIRKIVCALPPADMLPSFWMTGWGVSQVWSSIFLSPYQISSFPPEKNNPHKTWKTTVMKTVSRPSWHVREWTATRWRSDYVLDLPYAIQKPCPNIITGPKTVQNNVMTNRQWEHDQQILNFLSHLWTQSLWRKYIL